MFPALSTATPYGDAKAAPSAGPPSPVYPDQPQYEFAPAKPATIDTPSLFGETLPIRPATSATTTSPEGATAKLHGLIHGLFVKLVSVPNGCTFPKVTPPDVTTFTEVSTLKIIPS